MAEEKEPKNCPNRIRSIEGMVSHQPCPSIWICGKLGCQYKPKKDVDMRSDWEKVFGRKAW